MLNIKVHIQKGNSFTILIYLYLYLYIYHKRAHCEEGTRMSYRAEALPEKQNILTKVS